ncbi:MAG: sensor histidine kinase [Sphingomonas bacterium]|uniref:ATP-binding protein n=1 Tax=Sphingomonas bacterium TaxID=1895847 RepID=UPI002638DF04|nr:ATP-binding protein [Sphingomonas bacterium]MDB5704752.1 sensor histidine kinase [Sphingomonas bacterium]
MGETLRSFFGAGYAPRGSVLLWQPQLIWMHVFADALIAVSCLAIPLALITLLRKRDDIRYRGTISLFAAFILACGAAHVMSIWTVWHGNYGAEAVVKMTAAIASAATALALWILVPRAAAFPSTASLAVDNARLASTILARDAALDEMRAHLAQREHAQRALLQAQKLEALGQLTGGIAHDFNNLLQAITGNLELIEIQPDNAAGIARWSRNARQAVERGKKLTGQLLAFSRVQKLEIASFALAPLFERARDMISRSAGPLVRVDMAIPDEGLAVIADRTQLELAILNLAINARDAMPAGGAIRIRSTAASGKAHPDLAAGDYVMIEVDDEGSGMSPEVAARAFEPFFTTKGAGKGTGLGLSMVFGVVSQAGGAVEIDTAEGRGTTVRLFLRRAFGVAPTRCATATPAEPAKEAVLTGMNVLVIDDDPDVLQTVAATLEALGASTFTADGGGAGLTAAERDGIDLIVVDFAMPDHTGAEVAARSRAAFPDRPVLIMTGFSETARLKVVADPGVGLLRKPFATDALLRAIGELLPQED